MARTDASKANGWVPETTSGKVLTRIYQTSAVEQVARRVPMTSPSQRVPRFEQSGVDIVAEGALIPVEDATLDTVLLEASKWANRFTISVEDDRDAVVSVLDQAKLGWANSFAKELDNAALGVTAASTGPGTTVPFDSVYRVATQAGNDLQTAGELKFEMLNDAFAGLEDGDFNGDLVLIAHPAFKASLRNLKDADGLRVVTEPLAGGNQQIFGYDVVYSGGARTSATATDAPAGNPLLIVANRSQLLLGVLDGPESAVADFRWEYDERELKMRARRAFAVANADGVFVIEKTAGA